MPIKPNKGTQEYRLLQALSNGTVTTLGAMRQLGITSFHRRMTDLKERGYVIASAPEKNPETKVWYNVYRLVK